MKQNKALATSAGAAAGSGASPQLRRAMTNNSKRWFVMALIVCGLIGLFLTPKVNRLRVGAMMGNLDSMFELGVEYERIPGRYVRTDYGVGDYWLRKAAVRGHIPSILYLWDGWKVTNSHEAIHYVEIGANKKDIRCMSILGVAYEEGMYGLPKNAGKAELLSREIDRIQKEPKRGIKAGNQK